MKITVTQEDIDNGIPRTGWCCPIALAARRVIPNGFVPFVWGVYISIYKGGKAPILGAAYWSRYMPEEAIKAVRCYDVWDEEMVPFEFEIADFVPDA